MSDTTEEIRLPDVVFKGTNGKECEAFVAAIQEFAFSKGRDEDHQWLLRFAKSRLRGKALRWWAKLDPSIKKDWDLFVEALFDQYPSIEGPETDGNVTPVWSSTTFSPSPSTVNLPANLELNPNSTRESLPLGRSIPYAQPGHGFSHNPHLSDQVIYPTRQYDALSEGQQIGLLRVVTEEGTRIPQYIWWDYTVEELKAQGLYYTSYTKRTTLNRNEALIVSFLPSSAPHQISCLNSRQHLGRLVIHHDSNLKYYPLYGCNNDHNTGKPVASGSVFVLKAWNFLEDGTLRASLSLFSGGPYNETKFTTTEVHVDTSGSMIRLVKPGTPLEQDKPKGNPIHPFIRARIVFEPL
ncbi:hypothetical protein M407DRAFT_27965 [Tulasnella calospora MUT 4182]|uniref:Uncharacterized protein n=1 Tax=Tulasnella calospora MUT 4182 TaxID=1051891 RepID=A0A0C3KMH2_9AGAM|nr:hypothetical protein M407DRAFT_27965 [Tulasnella calospora MUT 4182]